jgi:hypothetical protein
MLRLRHIPRFRPLTPQEQPTREELIFWAERSCLSVVTSMLGLSESQWFWLVEGARREATKSGFSRMILSIHERYPWHVSGNGANGDDVRLVHWAD